MVRLVKPDNKFEVLFTVIERLFFPHYHHDIKIEIYSMYRTYTKLVEKVSIVSI